MEPAGQAVTLTPDSASEFQISDFRLRISANSRFSLGFWTFRCLVHARKSEPYPPGADQFGRSRFGGGLEEMARFANSGKNKIARAAARVSRKPGAADRRYRLRRSRRALRFLLPILRRRRGFAIRESPFHLPEFICFAHHSSHVSYPDVPFTSSSPDFPFLPVFTAVYFTASNRARFLLFDNSNHSPIFGASFHD
jgi:hypothetical protein